jgi:triosephosphate isomerase
MPLVAGNWKMNGTGAQLGEIDAVRAALKGGEGRAVEVALCPPATLLSRAAALAAG